MALGQGGTSFDWFFLAMAHWQLGNHDQARAWYEKSVAWMEKNSPRIKSWCPSTPRRRPCWAWTLRTRGEPDSEFRPVGPPD